MKEISGVFPPPLPPPPWGPGLEHLGGGGRGGYSFKVSHRTMCNFPLVVCGPRFGAVLGGFGRFWAVLGWFSDKYNELMSH